MARKTLIVQLVAVIALAGCSGDDEPAQPRAAAEPSAGTSAGLVDEPPGSIACAGLAAAIKGGTLTTAGVVDEILGASKSADAPIADAADRLKRAYDAAQAAVGNADEPDAVAAVGASASEMSDICADSGLQTVG
jgi:hypothetical protein